MSPQEQHQLRVWRTGEIRELLEDEDRLSQMVRGREEFQDLQRATEETMASNQNLAEISLSQKPRLRDTRLLLAVKYKELERLRNMVQVQQEHLAEKLSVHHTQRKLLQRISQSEEELELLCQGFAEGRTPPTEFLDLFLGSRRLHHVRSVLVKKLQEVIQQRPPQRLGDLVDPLWFSVDVSEQIRPLCGLTAAFLVPSCCRRPLLLPLGAHLSRLSPFSYDDDDDESPRAGLLGPRLLRWPVRPVRLQPLRQQQRRHQQARR